MKEPKYKYWDGEYNKMCDVRAIVWHGDIIANIEVSDAETLTRHPNMFFKHALLEYTGLKDKNGIEYADQDIMQWVNDGYTSKRLEKIVWNDGAWWIADLTSNDLLTPLTAKEAALRIIIGNVFKNTELLGVIP